MKKTSKTHPPGIDRLELEKLLKESSRKSCEIETLRVNIDRLLALIRFYKVLILDRSAREAFVAYERERAQVEK
jgi:hypothetical protein